MRNLVAEYVRAIARRVYFLLTGIVGAVLTAVSTFAPSYLRTIGIALFAVGLVGAQFQAWREMRAQRDMALDDANQTERRRGEREAALVAKLNTREKRKALRESLGEFFAQGEEIRAWIERAGEPVTKVHRSELVVGTYSDPKDADDESLRGSLERADEWEAQVADFLGQYLGKSYVAQFRSQVGTTLREAPKLGSDQHREKWLLIDRRLQVLAGIIKEAGDDLIGS